VSRPDRSSGFRSKAAGLHDGLGITEVPDNPTGRFGKEFYERRGEENVVLKRSLRMFNDIQNFDLMQSSKMFAAK
jgi:hypothetical protein